MTRIETWQEVFRERAEREQFLREKHPGFDLRYNWLVAAAMLAVIVGLIVWSIQIGLAKRDERSMESGRQEVYAAQAASAEAKAEEEKRKQEEFDLWLDTNSDILAQMFFGARNFEERYSYTEDDFRTYARAAFNRADARGIELSEVVFEEKQFMACSPHNTIMKRYKDMAKTFLLEWKTEERPCDVGYQYAELVPQGIFLWATKDGPRWRA